MPPIPKKASERQRRNAPMVPQTNLPAAGRSGRAPALPAHVKLGKPGRAWWVWAWRTPQAAAWDAGSLYVIARRAVLQDEVGNVDGAPLLACMREMRELDDRLGLTPKGLVALRWTITDDVPPAVGEPEDDSRVRYGHLTVAQ